MNIYDIASLAGVSIATVSRVVNGSEKVSEKTRQRVLDIIEREGYTPNVFAQGLGIGTMHTIGILVPTIADQYMATAVSYLEDQLEQYHYDCILSCCGFELATKQAHVQMLLSKHIDALILVGSTFAGSGRSDEETEYIREAAKQVPVFVINGAVEGDRIYCSVCDDRRAMSDITSELIADGRRQILFLTDSRSYSAQEKSAGYVQALRDSGLPVHGELMLRIRNDIYAAMELLQQQNILFDAVVATDDGLAVGAVKYALRKGLRIPQDLSIVGYNNSTLAIACNPELSSVDNRTEEICRSTIDNIFRVLQGDTAVPACSTAQGRLVSRETTAF